MNKKTVFLLCVLLLFVVSCGSDSAPSTEKIKWQNYAQGMEQGKKEGKKVFISFYADWCTFCEKLASTSGSGGA